MAPMGLSAPRHSRYSTKQELVYRTLHDAIMRCQLAPGQRLVIDELARRLEVSAIPVREALQMLQSEGLVVNVPHVGATVAPLSRESIHELFTVMEGLEIVGSRSAAERLTETDAEGLAQILATMDRAIANAEYEQWGELNTRFHLGITEVSAMPMLVEMTARVLGHWDRLRRYYFNGVLVHRLGQAQREHHAILAALRSRDLDTVEETVKLHNRGALRAYTEFVQSQTTA